MNEEDFFTHERAKGLIELMIKQLDEDNMTDALRNVLTGANSHGVYLAKYALETALEDMESVEKIREAL